MHQKQLPPTETPDPKHATPSPTGWRIEPGTRLDGRFVVLDHLGAGGGAVVVRARDEQLTTTVAVKLLRSGQADLRRRFAREAEVLANVKHPSIVQVLAHGEDAGSPYMALELLDGPDLGQHLAAAGSMPWRQVVEIGVQLADALAVVHSKGLIHRDVKPANVMLVAGGEPVLVKLIDFGVARVTETYEDPTGFTPKPRRATDVGMAIGTPGYLPLEAGLVPADERFDVFGLAATMYELLTGELPGVDPMPLREVNPACEAPEDLGHVLAAALALEPGDRTQSAAELGRALQAIRTAHPERSPARWFDGRYERLGVLGTGAKGDVYLANHRGSGHDVALKFLQSDHPDDLLRFEREARLLALLDAPGLPRFFDYAPRAERPYIAMARARGLPAVRFCRSNDKVRLKPIEVLEVGLQVARTLAVLHEHGVLHRDINANNVMIELLREPRVTLLDLGCAALTDQFYAHASVRYLTPPEARVAIPDGGIEKLAWSAPEARAGEGWTDKSDVYSLGMLLYRLVTGRLPTMPGGSDPRRVAPTCPADLARIIIWALQPNPGDRPSAVRLAADIQDILDPGADEVADEPGTERQATVLKLVVPDRSSPSPPVASVVARPASTARGWTLFDTQVAGSERPPVAAAPVEAVSSVPIAPRVRRRHAGLALIGVAVICAWWVGRVTSPSSITPATVISPSPTPTRPVDAVQLSTSTPAMTATPDTTQTTQPVMGAALAGVAPKLRTCAAGTDGLLVDFEVVQGGEQFAAVAVIGDHAKRVHDCVSDAVADIRFAPAPAQTFTEDYLP